MKKLFLLLFVGLISLTFVKAQVHNGNLGIFNQSQVNAFNYKEVTGSLTINGSSNYNGGDPITDLSPLSILTKVGESFHISFTNETDLNDLANLQTVGGKLGINANANMPNITLANLSSVGSLEIGTSAVTSINLPSLTTTTNGLFRITSNSVLTNINFSSLTTVNGNMNIQGNSSLTNLDGFSALNSISGNLTVSSNKSLNGCCILKNLLNTPGAVKGSTFIYDNKTNCNSKDEVLTTCTSTSASNNALTFDGNDDFIELGNSQFYKESFTVEGWIKPQQNSKDKTGAIFHARFNVRFTAIYAEVMSNGKIRFFVRNPPHNAGGAFIIGNKNVLDGNWHHFAAVKGDDDKLRLYIDGELDGTSRGSIRDFPETTGHELLLGTNWAGSTRYFKGQMDEIRFWDRARTQEEIKRDMNKVLTGTQSGLVAYYNFNQGTANDDNNGMTTLNDSKGTLNGTLKNFQLNGSISNFSAGAPVNN